MERSLLYYILLSMFSLGVNTEETREKKVRPTPRCKTLQKHNKPNVYNTILSFILVKTCTSDLESTEQHKRASVQ